MKRFIPFLLGFFLPFIPKIAGDSLHGIHAGWYFVVTGAVAYFFGFMAGSSDVPK